MRKFNQYDGDNTTMLDQLRKLHPQLTEKAIVDYVNSLEVLDDHLRFRDKTNNKFLTRILDSITGRTAQSQQIIDRNIATNIKIVSVRLEDIELYQGESDIYIARLADKLKETLTGVMRLQERQNKLAEDVQATKQHLEQFEIQVDNRCTRLESEVEFLSAKAHLDQVFIKWQARYIKKYPPLAGLYLMIDELYWGMFGIYCRKKFGANQVDQLMEQLGDKALILMETNLKGEVSQLMFSKEWLSSIQNLPKESREALSYLSDWADAQTTPVTWAIKNAALLESELPDDFPRVFSGEHAINHLMYENKKRIQRNNDY